MSFRAHFAKELSVLDCAEEKRNSRVEWRGEGPEAGVAGVRGWAGRGGEKGGVVVGEEEEGGVDFLGDISRNVDGGESNLG